MSELTSGLRTMVRNVTRIAPGPALIRAIAFGAGELAFLLALPEAFASPGARIGGTVLAALAALSPGRGVVTFVQLVTAALWVAGTGPAEGTLSAPALIGLASALYVQHTGCALAAAVPLDAVVSPSVLLRWFVRSLGVILITAVVGVVAVTLPGRLHASPELTFPLLGVLGAIFGAGILAYLALRGPRSGA